MSSKQLSKAVKDAEWRLIADENKFINQRIVDKINKPEPVDVERLKHEFREWQHCDRQRGILTDNTIDRLYEQGYLSPKNGHIEGLEDAIKMVESKALDHCDLMVDEFMRIRVCPDVSEEVKGLCTRAIEQTYQHVSVLDRLASLQRLKQQMDAGLANIRQYAGQFLGCMCHMGDRAPGDCWPCKMSEIVSMCSEAIGDEHHIADPNKKVDALPADNWGSLEFACKHLDKIEKRDTSKGDNIQLSCSSIRKIIHKTLTQHAGYIEGSETAYASLIEHKQELQTKLDDLNRNYQASLRQIRDQARENGEMRKTLQIALGHLTGGMDGDYKDCDLVDTIKQALKGGA